MLKKPGKKPSSATASSTATARAWEAVAKSRTPSRLSPKVAGWRCWPIVTKTSGLPQTHEHAVGRATPIHDGDPHEARTLRLEEERMPPGSVIERQSVDENGQWSHSACDFHCDRVRFAVFIACELKLRPIGREHDARLRLTVFSRQPAGSEILQWRRQLPGRGE